MSSSRKKSEQRESTEEGSERASGERTRTEEPMRSLDTERDLKGVTEEKYRLLVENASQGIIVIQDGMLKYLNPKAAEVTGWPKQELISKPFADIVHPDDRSMVQRVTRGGWEVRGNCKHTPFGSWTSRGESSGWRTMACLLNGRASRLAWIL